MLWWADGVEQKRWRCIYRGSRWPGLSMRSGTRQSPAAIHACPPVALLVSAMHLVVISVMADLSWVLFLAPMQRKEF